MTDDNGNNNPILSREFMLFSLTGTAIVGVFVLVALQVPIPDWVAMLVVSIASVSLGQRIERLR
jgi:uncharacterized protein (DUF983 family)